MQFTTLITLFSVASGAIAGCGGASGCCCHDFDSVGNNVLYVQPGTSSAEIREYLDSAGY